MLSIFLPSTYTFEPMLYAEHNRSYPWIRLRAYAKRIGSTRKSRTSQGKVCFRIRLKYLNLNPPRTLSHPVSLSLSLSLSLTHALALSQRTHTSYMQSQTNSTYPNSCNTSASPHSFTHSFTLFARMQLVILFLIQSTLPVDLISIHKCMAGHLSAPPLGLTIRLMPVFQLGEKHK